MGKVREIDLGPNSYKPILLHLEESDLGSYACKQEAFAPVLCAMPLEGAANAKEFLKKAQEIANSDKIFGSLSATVAIPDKIKEDLGAEFWDTWIQGMEWGSVGINEWALMRSLIP